MSSEGHNDIQLKAVLNLSDSFMSGLAYKTFSEIIFFGKIFSIVKRVIV